MPDIELSPADLAEFETDLVGDLAIDSHTQDLLFGRPGHRGRSPTPRQRRHDAGHLRLIKWGPMEVFDATGPAQEFFPDGRHRTLLVMNLGYPAQDAHKPRQPRPDYDEVVTTV